MSLFQRCFWIAIQFWFPDETILINHRPEWLHGLEIDLYLPRLKVGFEIQGRQHYLWSPNLQNTPREYLDQRRRDGLKCSYAAAAGVRLVKLREFDGIYEKMRRAFPGRPFRLLPAEIRAAWEQYRKRRHRALQTDLAFKVRRDGTLTPTNRASSEWLRNRPTTESVVR